MISTMSDPVPFDYSDVDVVNTVITYDAEAWLDFVKTIGFRRPEKPLVYENLTLSQRVPEKNKVSPGLPDLSNTQKTILRVQEKLKDTNNGQYEQLKVLDLLEGLRRLFSQVLPRIREDGDRTHKETLMWRMELLNAAQWCWAWKDAK
ncbi:hypothetical protein CPLU01_13343 [Colletotrichum plurivorum]|uniref:Uncharacterized protein n=1 Tax=Colletotrichum plurivorum TaxID=2175906 RepID=A0A8H6JT53_9PEZI|nr:hypothetical protein CPLU01_13343 [Colletotrichum plurivorum]